MRAARLFDRAVRAWGAHAQARVGHATVVLLSHSPFMREVARLLARAGVREVVAATPTHALGDVAFHSPLEDFTLTYVPQHSEEMCAAVRRATALVAAPADVPPADVCALAPATAVLLVVTPRDEAFDIAAFARAPVPVAGAPSPERVRAATACVHELPRALLESLARGGPERARTCALCALAQAALRSRGAEAPEEAARAALREAGSVSPDEAARVCSLVAVARRPGLLDLDAAELRRAWFTPGECAAGARAVLCAALVALVEGAQSFVAERGRLPLVYFPPLGDAVSRDSENTVYAFAAHERREFTASVAAAAARLGEFATESVDAAVDELLAALPTVTVAWHTPWTEAPRTCAKPVSRGSAALELMAAAITAQEVLKALSCVFVPVAGAVRVSSDPPFVRGGAAPDL